MACRNAQRRHLLMLIKAEGLQVIEGAGTLSASCFWAHASPVDTTGWGVRARAQRKIDNGNDIHALPL